MEGACGGEAVVRGAGFSTCTFPASPCSLPPASLAPEALRKHRINMVYFQKQSLDTVFANKTCTSDNPAGCSSADSAPSGDACHPGRRCALGRSSVLGSELGHQARIRVRVLCLYGYHSSCCSRELRGRPGGSPGLCVSSPMSPLCDEALLPRGQSPLRDLGLLFSPECKEPQVPRRQPAALSQGPWVSPGESVSLWGSSPPPHRLHPAPERRAAGSAGMEAP